MCWSNRHGKLITYNRSFLILEVLSNTWDFIIVFLLISERHAFVWIKMKLNNNWQWIILSLRQNYYILKWNRFFWSRFQLCLFFFHEMMKFYKDTCFASHPSAEFFFPIDWRHMRKNTIEISLIYWNVLLWIFSNSSVYTNW